MDATNSKNFNNKWHSISLIEVFFETESKKEGLTSGEADERLRKYGKNVLPQEKPYSKIRLFLRQFNSPLMYILLTTVVISLLLGHYTDTIFIAVVLLINTTVGFYQENKANQSLRALKKMVQIKAKVMRDGYEKEINSEDIATGDVMILKSGDKVPADGRIIESRGLKINEAALTGEWLSSEKNAADILAEKTPLSERSNMVFMGTIVEEGRAKVVIVGTGLSTQIGEIVSLLKETKEGKTPLQKKIISLSKIAGFFIILVIIVIVVIGYFRGEALSDIFIAALALAVSAIPEGLLPAVTVILVLGMRRIFKAKGLVRKLVATETLGSVTVICTDKTGTLTEGRMQVSHILTSTKELLADGINGHAKENNANGEESHILALRIATLTNDAFVENPKEELQNWIVRGSPTERALLLAGMQAGLNKYELEKNYPVIDRISFESDYKYAATLHRIQKNKNMLYVLGAPEVVMAKAAFLDIDGKMEKLGTKRSDKLLQKFESLTQKGLRVIACAHRGYALETKYQNLNELVDGLSLAGFIALKDPLRKDAKESIEITKKAGIRTVIVTGDHKLTACAIAQEVGIQMQKENIMEGKELEEISDEDLKEKAKSISIYARVSPRHKSRIVDALQANGEVVAMLGDGVNDASALKSADIGVTVGSGTDVAKEVADLVLLDNNFRTIIKAIEQGRVVFENIRKVFVYLVADDFSEIFLFFGSMIMGLPLPLLPAQILWVNVVEDGFPSIALTTEQETKGVMEEKPRNPKEPILNKLLGRWMIAVFFITGIAAFATFLLVWKFTGDIDKTRTVVFTLVAFDSVLFAFTVRSFKRSIFRKDILSNRYLSLAALVAILLLLAAIYIPLLQKLLGTYPLGIWEWSVVLGVTFIEMILLAIFKKKIFFAKTS